MSPFNSTVNSPLRDHSPNLMISSSFQRRQIQTQPRRKLFKQFAKPVQANESRFHRRDENINVIARLTREQRNRERGRQERRVARRHTTKTSSAEFLNRESLFLNTSRSENSLDAVNSLLSDLLSVAHAPVMQTTISPQPLNPKEAYDKAVLDLNISLDHIHGQKVKYVYIPHHI
jgi:hypothetical protein